MTNHATARIDLTAVLLAAVVALSGCRPKGYEALRPQQPSLAQPGGPTGYAASTSPPQQYGPQRIPVPAPLDKLLPDRVTIHPFTGARTFDDAGEVQGFEVRIKVLDDYGDPTKAFGEYLFMLYTYRTQSENPRGERLGMWPESLIDPDKNQLHWDAISQSYKFNLRYRDQLVVGHQYVLEVYFTSPFTERLSAKRVFVADR